MAMDKEAILREQQLNSYGRLMASFSHELKNHLGIIRESGGLIADVIEIHAAGLDPALVSRIEKATASIEKRVVIAAQLFHHLSSFAHRADMPVASFDFNEFCAEAIALSERFARLKQVEILFEPSSVLPALYSSPTLLHHLFLLTFEKCLVQMEGAERLHLVPSAENNGIQLRFIREKSLFLPELFQDRALELVLAKIQGTLSVREKTVEISLMSLQ